MENQVVNREVLLNALSSVAPGLSIHAEFEQSNCFAFVDGKIRTYNDEICCELDSPLNGVTGAVHAKPLLELLNKMTDDEVRVKVDDGQFLLQGKGRRRAAIACYDMIVLEYQQAGKPKKWHKLDPDFLEALEMVAECASHDQAAYVYTCVRLTPDYIEAMDSWQAGRYKIKCPVDEPIYIRRQAVKYIVELGMEEVSFVDDWAHFRSPDGLRLSCRCSTNEEFPDIDEVYNVKGKKTNLPKGLADAAARAEILCEDDDKYVTVKLSENMLTISSRGADGWYEEDRKIKYTGPDLMFQISAPLLAKVAEKYENVKVGRKRIGVRVGSFSYVTALKVD